MLPETAEIKLTQYSKGGGCGCKIAPQVLEEILKTTIAAPDHKNLIVGNSSKDDAAVLDLGNGTALISTTDFFMPIVDDPFTFGKIAAANAISDVYAMGGTPTLAIAILGWPIDKLGADIAQKVIEGGREVCRDANIPLAGGHSIDSPEPFFGLSVNGIVQLEHLKKNDTARAGDYIFITKSIGVGILSTAGKRGKLLEEDQEVLYHQLTQLNKIGAVLSKIPGVNAMTDVTGFGLAGHLTEMAEGSGLSAELYYSKLPVLNNVPYYLKEKTTPDATFRNWNNYGKNIGFEKGVNVMEAFSLLPDPQTNGGLLIAVDSGSVGAVKTALQAHGLEAFMEPIGIFTQQQEKTIYVRQ
jgi:selenide, water dikinase